MKKFFILSMVFMGAVAPAVGGAANSPKPKMVRVAIARDARELYVAIEGGYHFRDGVSSKVIGQGARLAKSRVRLLDRGVLIGLDVYPANRLIIEPSRDAAIIINNHRFRGEVTLIRTLDNRISAINNINIEDYIKGVLYHEMSHHWPMEALKAQAVAARTYALHSLNGANDYDVTNDIYSQVYGGRESERYRTGLAVERTAGQVLVYQGKVLPAYFHAACAGMTEDAHELWPMIDLPPLRGVPCPFCQDSPHMHWKVNFHLKDVQEALNRQGYKIGPIKNMAIVDRNRSERINNLKITGRNGQELIIKGKDFREIMGPNVVKSNNYDIVMQGYYVDFIGKGWGHGVGLCQWGAFGMARQQFTYKQILNYYYPRADLVDYHELRP